MRKERKKATKHDAAHRLASVLHAEGKDGVEAEFEKSEAFHDAWRLKSQDMLARAEFRRRKLVQRLQVGLRLDPFNGCHVPSVHFLIQFALWLLVSMQSPTW